MVLPLLVGVAAGTAVGSALTQTRAGQFKVDIAGESLTAEQIYSRITGGVGNTDLEVVRDIVGRLADHYVERGRQLDALVTKLNTAWQGQSAEAAAARTAPLVRAFEESASSLERVREALRGQIGSFSDIRGAVEPVPAEPPKSGFVNDVNPFTTDTDRAISEYNKNAANNVARYEVYNQDSVANGALMPTTYSSLPVDVPSISVIEPSREGRVGPGDGTNDVTVANVAVANVAERRERAEVADETVVPSDSKGHREVVESSVDRGSGTTRTSHAVSTAPPHQGEPASATRVPATGPSDFGSPTGLRRSQQAGNAGGVGRPAGEAGRTGAGGGRRDTTGRLGRGLASGVGDLSNAARRAGAPTAPAAGTAGLGGAPYGAPPATSRDDDDIEHRNMLIRPDPDELFGVPDAVTPAVIGEEEDA